MRRLRSSRREAQLAAESRVGVHYVGHPGQLLVLIETDGAVTGVLPHVVSRSRGGLAWGYTGAGAADLAYSILIDVLGGAERCHDCTEHDAIEWNHRSLAALMPTGVSSVPVTLCADCARTVPAAAEEHFQQFKVEVVAVAEDPSALWSVSQPRVQAWLREQGVDVGGR